MKRRGGILWVGFASLLAFAQLCIIPVKASADTAPSLVFREVKITGDEFIVLQNAGTAATPNLNNYWLGYTGDDQASPVPTQQLPANVSLQPGQALLLTAGTTQTCDAVAVARLSASLSDTHGVLSLWQATSTGFTILSNQTVKWDNKGSYAINSKSDASVADAVWYKDADDSSATWQLGDFQADCTLAFSASGGGVSSVSWPQNDIDPPAIIESLADDGDASSGPYLPAADIGLLPPQITELLPNPSGTGNDATDEFIELYNPNASLFDLSGFTLQTGMTTKHNYTFPAGTMLAPKTFVAFYSADTKLSLSNTSGQADLKDPFGTVIAQTDVYSGAKDGQAWALAKGTWYWTNKPTPNRANVINQTGGGSSAKTASGKSSSGSTKGASTTGESTNVSANSPSDVAEAAPIHPGVLAAVAAAAVAYGVYEYRHDVANRYHRLRVYRDARRSGRK